MAEEELKDEKIEETPVEEGAEDEYLEKLKAVPGLELDKFEDIPFDPQRKILKLYAGLPVWTTIPDYVGFQGEFVWVNDSSVYKLYSYIDGAWKFISSTDLTGGTDTALHKHDARYYTETEVDTSLAAKVNKDGSTAFTGTGAGFRDEDAMTSDDATATASQQSIKKYVDDSVSGAGASIFGDGSDGNKTASSNETITSDKYYNNLTINNGVTFNSGGYRIFVKGTLTTIGTSKIANDGGDAGNGGNGGQGITGAGSAGSAGSASNGGYLIAGPVGKIGVVGGNASASSASYPGNGGNHAENATPRALGSNGTRGGGKQNEINIGRGGYATNPPGYSGGDGGLAGGSGAGEATSTSINQYPYSTPLAITLLDMENGVSPANYQGQAGSSSAGSGAAGKPEDSSDHGSCGGGGGSGGSGGAGGFVCVYANKIVFSGNGRIQAFGGDGGNGGNGGNGTDPGGGYSVGGGGGGSGGAGGNGGIVIVVYNSINIDNPSLQILAYYGSGGTAGTKGTGYGPNYGDSFDGGVGADGNTGKVIII